MKAFDFSEQCDLFDKPRRFTHKKGDEVRGLRLFNTYKGFKYHAVHNERNQMYLCDCVKPIFKFKPNTDTAKYRFKTTKLCRQILLELRLNIGNNIAK